MKIGEIVFENIKTYSKSHTKIFREKYQYLETKINGIRLTISKNVDTDFVHVEFLNKSYHYTSKDISYEDAAKMALLKLKVQLSGAINLLKWD